VTGGAGGVGSTAIQLAKCMYGASFVATTASAGNKAEFCKSLGADRVVDYRSEDFSKVLASDNEEDRFDFIFDCIGEGKKCPSLLKSTGTLVSIVTSPSALCLREFLEQSETRKFQRITWGVEGFLCSAAGAAILDHVTGAKSLRGKCRGRFFHVIGTGNGDIMEHLAKALASGDLKASIDKSYPLLDALQALKHIESGRAMGKVVVLCSAASSSPVN